LGHLTTGIVINAGGINVKHLPPEYLLGGTDVPNMFEQFLKIDSTSRLLQPVVIQSKSFDYVFP
jgi:hypothetical protein